MPKPVDVTKVVTETIMVPEYPEFVMMVSDTGGGGNPQYRPFVLVDGKHLCYVDELPHDSNSSYIKLRENTYEYYLESLGVPVGPKE